ncbi:MAG: metallophosphoesterase family protein [Pseudomonadota bacterium]|nr:metallophosphoesterase family protein [Pseudomonadota bacterium]
MSINNPAVASWRPTSPLLRGLAALALGLALAGGAAAQLPGENEPNLAVPANSQRYVASEMPDRIIATPAQDAATGFAVNWRTNAKVQAPRLEIVVAVDSPDTGNPRVLTATTRALQSGNGIAHTHRVDIDGLTPDTLYMFRVEGEGTWSGWRQLRTLARADKPLTLLYFGDTQNKNLSHVSRLTREAMRHAGGASIALYAGDLVSEGTDDNEWGEWFEAAGDLPDVMLVAPAIGNHEYWEEFEDTPQERRVLGDHWRASFALPRNGAGGQHSAHTTYWFDAQGVRFVVLDGTSALDLGSADEQARWLDRVLSANPQRWSVVLIHQPMFSPRGRGASDKLRAALMPVIDKHMVDLVLQGHDHTYGRRSGERSGQTLPQYVVSVAGPKQYRLSAEAKRTMAPTAEDTQLFQVIRVEQDRLRYQAYTATGRLYDDFEIERDKRGGRRVIEHRRGRIAERDCSHRDATLGGRKDRCWE